MWVGGLKKRAKCTYVIKVWPLTETNYLLSNSGKRGSFESQRLSICSNLSSRRQSSARTMSQNVQQNLKALRQEQHRYEN